MAFSAADWDDLFGDDEEEVEVPEEEGAGAGAGAGAPASSVAIEEDARSPEKRPPSPSPIRAGGNKRRRRMVLDSDEDEDEDDDEVAPTAFGGGSGKDEGGRWRGCHTDLLFCSSSCSCCICCRCGGCGGRVRRRVRRRRRRPTTARTSSGMPTCLETTYPRPRPPKATTRATRSCAGSAALVPGCPTRSRGRRPRRCPDEPASAAAAAAAAPQGSGLTQERDIVARAYAQESVTPPILACSRWQGEDLVRAHALGRPGPRVDVAFALLQASCQG